MDGSPHLSDGNVNEWRVQVFFNFDRRSTARCEWFLYGFLYLAFFFLFCSLPLVFLLYFFFKSCRVVYVFSLFISIFQLSFFFAHSFPCCYFHFISFVLDGAPFRSIGFFSILLVWNNKMPADLMANGNSRKKKIYISTTWAGTKALTIKNNIHHQINWFLFESMAVKSTWNER